MTIHEKLLHIQQNLNAPKNQYNSFGKYKYRSLEDIMQAVKPLLAELKCTLTFKDEYIEDPHCGPALVCTATLFDGEEAAHQQAIVGVDIDKKGMDKPQSFGAASSYGRKYAANGLFLIDDVKDPDATNKHGKDKTPESNEKQMLTKASPNYAKAAEYLAKGGSIADIEKKYYLSPEVRESLTK